MNARQKFRRVGCRVQITTPRIWWDKPKFARVAKFYPKGPLRVCGDVMDGQYQVGIVLDGQTRMTIWHQSHWKLVK